MDNREEIIKLKNCAGITKLRKECDRSVKQENESFCHLHKYQEEIPLNVLKQIFNNDPNCKYNCCTRCFHWHNYETTWCQPCLDKNKKDIANKKKKCGGYRKKDGLPCECRTVNDTLYCKDHSFMTEYTENELSNLRKCSGQCGRYIYWLDTTKKTCDACRNLGKKNRENAKENDTRDKCINFEKCGNYANKELHVKYCLPCNKSNLVLLKKGQIIASGKKVCKRWHHNENCLEELDINDPNTSCLNCRLSANVNETKQRNKKKNIAIEFNNKQNTKEVEKILTVVKKNKDIERQNARIDEANDKSRQLLNKEIVNTEKEKLTEENFNNVNWMCITCNEVVDFKNNFIDEKGCKTQNCFNCRKLNKTLDDLYRKAEKQITNKEKKIIKRLKKKNPEFAKIKYKIYRMNKINAMGGLDEYRKLCAEQTKKFRLNHPDTVESFNADRRTLPKWKLFIYKSSAKERKIPWELEDDFAQELFKMKCHYCGEMNVVKGKRVEQGVDEFEYVEINGIDRMDNTKGYIKGNVVPCCTICNYVKFTTNYEIYLKRIKHMLTLFLISDKLYRYPEAFPNKISGSFNHFRNSAAERKKDFSIFEEEFDVLVNQDCYMCGKESNDRHQNGLDRYDNNLGYTVKNCFSCCTTCNYTKNNYELDVILKKFYLTACNLFENEFKFDKNVYDSIKDSLALQIELRNVSKVNMIKEFIDCNDELFKKSNGTNFLQKNKNVNSDTKDYDDFDDHNDLKNIDNGDCKPTISKEQTESKIKKRRDALIKQIYRLKKKPDSENMKKLQDAQNELNALDCDPDYELANYKKQAMTATERKRKSRAKLNEGKPPKAPPKSAAQRAREYRERKKHTPDK